MALAGWTWTPQGGMRGLGLVDAGQRQAGERHEEERQARAHQQQRQADGPAVHVQRAEAAPPAQEEHGDGAHGSGMMTTMDGMPNVVGQVDHERNGFNPTDILTDFDYGQVSDAIKILKVLGDAQGLRLKHSTWKRVVGEAKSVLAEQALQAPKK